MSATLRLRYSAGEGRLSFRSGENGVGTSEICEEVDMVVGEEGRLGCELSDVCSIYIIGFLLTAREGRCISIARSLLRNVQEQGRRALNSSVTGKERRRNGI